MKNQKGISLLILIFIAIIILSIIFLIKTQTSKENEQKKYSTYLDEYNSKTYTITFDTDGGEAIEPMIVTPKTNLSPITPHKPGYEFTSWTLNGVKFDFSGYVNSRITSDVTLKANYQKITYISSGATTEEERKENAKKANYANSSNLSSNNSKVSTPTKSTKTTSTKSTEAQVATPTPTSTNSESKSSYIASCKDYNSQYDDMQRNPNSYKGLRMKFRGMVDQRWRQNGSMVAFTISACTSDNRHIGMVYCSIDNSVLNGGNLLQYDYVNVYGEFKGLTDNLVSLSGYANYPSLEIKYIELTQY